MKRALVIALIAASSAHSYIRSVFNFSDGSSVAIRRTDFANVQFYLNNAVTAGIQSSASGKNVTVISSGSNPTYAVRAALATWNNVNTSSARFLALKSTTKIIDPNDQQNTIAIGSTAADVSAVGGAVAITLTISTATTPGASTSASVSDSDIILNPAITFSTDGSTTIDLQGVITHELGHALGLNHSGLLGSLMFQFAEITQRYLSPDEISFDTAVYPASGVSLATITGKVITGSGPAQYALVELIDTVNGNALTALTGSDGSYSLEGPAGSYVVYAEPVTASSIVQPGNLYLSPMTQITTNFQPTVLGGISSPAAVTVGAGGTVSVPTLTVTTGKSSLTTAFAGIGKAGASGDIQTVTSYAPYVIPSGQAVDIGITSVGLDAAASVQVIGKGISVRTGSVHAEPGISFGGQPLIRATLDIAPVQVPTLASLVITDGPNVLTLSGVLALVPPTPTFSTAAVVNAASYTGAGVVSPGGISSIYDTSTKSLGPNPFVQSTSYDLYGNLPTTVGGVTVTFDGIPAPIYLSSASQLNIQVPFELVGKTSTSIVVDNYGSLSAPVTVQVSPTQPAFFTFTPQGKDVIIQNFADNYALNNASTPAARGSVVLIYGTGIGQLSYPVATGQPGVVPPVSYTSNYSCDLGGVKAAAYGYWNYGFVGEALWVITVPSNSATGAVALTCTDSVTGGTTQPATIYVK